jgi:hypothetical protein
MVNHIFVSESQIFASPTQKYNASAHELGKRVHVFQFNDKEYNTRSSGVLEADPPILNELPDPVVIPAIPGTAREGRPSGRENPGAVRTHYLPLDPRFRGCQEIGFLFEGVLFRRSRASGNLGDFSHLLPVHARRL